MEKIKSLSQYIFSLTEKQAEVILDTIIDKQLMFNDDVSELEDVFCGVIDFLETLEHEFCGSAHKLPFDLL